MCTEIEKLWLFTEKQYFFDMEAASVKQWILSSIFVETH